MKGNLLFMVRKEKTVNLSLQPTRNPRKGLSRYQHGDGQLMKYPIWSERTPHTDRRARISRHKIVSGVRAIEVRGASYRNASLDGVFELEDQDRNADPIEYKPSGRIWVRVVCAWHGVVPPTTYPHLNLTGALYKVLDNYSGEVADDIS